MRSSWLLLGCLLGTFALVRCGPTGSTGDEDSGVPDDAAVPDDSTVSGDVGTEDAEVVGCQDDNDCDHGNDTQCLSNVCSPGLGICQMTPADNGTPCGDGDSCTDGESCQGGFCLGAEACCEDGLDNDGDGQTDCDDLDCVGLPVCDGTCPVVPVPDPIPDTPLPGETSPGTFETVNAGGFTDDYVYNSAHDLKVGTRRQWGGTIIFFGMGNGSPGMNNTNTIDANDTGREVQVAFYDPDRHMQNCAWNASCQSTSSTCPMSITYLGWNPVQGGNRCNNGSGVQSVDTTDGAITVTTIPLFWNPNWDRQDCSDVACNDPSLNTRVSDVQVVQRVRFVRYHVVELDYTVINLDTLAHAATGQEFPTVYTANGQVGPDLWRLFSSSGAEIAIDTPGNDGFYYENFSSTDGWVTMQNDALTYGVGMYTENKLPNWQGWQLRSLPFNNIRPVFSFGIPSQATIRARSYLILGNLGTVTSEAQWLDQNLPPFGVLDSPTADAQLSGTVAMHGWVLDNKGVTTVELHVDGTYFATANYGTSRPDVCAVWPHYADCNDVGYSLSVDVSSLSACPHLLEIVATDTDGNQRIIANRRVTVAP